MNQEHLFDRQEGKRKEEVQDQQLIQVYQVPYCREEEALEAALEAATEVLGLPGEVPGPLLEDQLATILQVQLHLCLIILSEEAVKAILEEQIVKAKQTLVGEVQEEAQRKQYHTRPKDLWVETLPMEMYTPE